MERVSLRNSWQCRIATAIVFAGMLTSLSQAIVINDEWFDRSGGDLNDVAGTLDAGYAEAQAYSYEDQFLAVGTIGQCTATWIGNDADANTSFFLTASHCIQPDPAVETFARSETFTDWDGNAVASGTGTGYIPPERINKPPGFGGSSTDIALLEMPGQAVILDHSGVPIERPLFYDGNAEVGHEVSLVGYGSWGIGSVGSNGSYSPSSGPRRAGGTNVIDNAFEADHALRAVSTAPATGNATPNESISASGDSGSAWWQQHDDAWSIVATNCCGGSGPGYGKFSNGTRVSGYIDWIESIYPDVRLWSERDPSLITLTPELSADDQANGVLGQLFTTGSQGGAITQIAVQRASSGTATPDAVFMHVYEDTDLTDGIDAGTFLGASISSESLNPTNDGFTFWDFDGALTRLDPETQYMFAFANSATPGDTVAARVGLHNGNGTSGYTGGFAPVDFDPRMDLNTIFQISIDTDALTGILGDVNQDGFLDQFDIDDFIAGWRSDTTGLGDIQKSMLGDLNLDGVTSLPDAFILHEALNTAGAGGLDFSRLTNVPEPGTIALALLGSAFFLFRARSQRNMETKAEGLR